MRYLSKIVLINSARVKLAEVEVDGNVHFTGTQGVGKTTLLRALLFFYNCRKDRLGIRTQGQHTFDDFYLPTPASYIVYQVSRGKNESPFSIIVFKQHGKAVFRFVDASYSRDWFIDDSGNVTSEPLTVRQRIADKGIDQSNIIRRYTDYLNILYGNRGAVISNDLYKYYLLRSRQYNNIPRIIQNVFLNERVDAGFIKDAIINSIMGEDEDISVDLSFFRSKLIHFNDELRDISLWSTKNRHGIVEIRQIADRIIELSNNIKAANFSLHENCGMLNYAMTKVERDIPILRNRIIKSEESIARINDSISRITSDFEQENNKINGQIAILKRDLRNASELKKKYESMGIHEILSRAEKLDVLKLQLHQKEQMLTQLTTNHASISDKYGHMRERCKFDKEQYVQTCIAKKNAVKEAYSSRELERINIKTKQASEIREKYSAQILDIENRMDDVRELLQEEKVRRVEASSLSVKKEELSACEKNITDLTKSIHRYSEDKLKAENQLDTIKNRFDVECQHIESKAELKIKDLDGDKKQLEAERNEAQMLLDNAHGSLCEWLDDNIVGWDKSIGKVVDEKGVLYCRNLNPKLVDNESRTLFGISIDVDSIDKEVRTPSMIKATMSQLEEEIQSINNDIIIIREDKEREIEEREKEVKDKMKLFKTEIEKLSHQIEVCRSQIKSETLQCESLKEEEKKHRDEVMSNCDAIIKKYQIEIDTLKSERAGINKDYTNEIRQSEKIFKEGQNVDKTRCDKQLKSIDDEINLNEERYNESLKKIDKAEESELLDSGVNLSILDSVKSEITKIKSQLEQIDREREIITEYRKDCRELIDCVPKMQMDRKKLECEIDNLQKKYETRRNRHEHKKHDESQSLSVLRKTLDKAEDSKHKAEEFTKSASCPIELKETSAISTDLDCPTIISTIRDLIGEIYRESDALKERTNDFRKRLSPNNTFKFPTDLSCINDYHNYAESLEDFIENDKIKDFEQVTSNLYRDILSRAASDFNMLLKRESDILRIIKDINYDFEKKTFAGVIRSIELRLEKNTLPIIAQLQKITEFWNLHQLELDEINLFSTDEHSDINKESVKYIKALSAALSNASELKNISLEQTFSLKFRIRENDNTTDWVENIRAVGSEGTDILVKAIINILLISVFKKRAGQNADFRLHCMMDEVGRLADENIQGILNFANQRGIFIVNSSPKVNRPLSYRRLYMLSKDKESNTTVQPILSIREAEKL